MATRLSRKQYMKQGTHHLPHRSRTPLVHSSRSKLRQLERKLRHNVVYVPISHFYHVTNSHSKAGIICARKLRGSVAKMTQLPSIRSPIHGRLRGVFFNCNLRRNSYGLPRRSPFGSERIKIPITRFASSKFHLFYNSDHKTYKHGIHYVILVLVKESDPKYKFCKAHMNELNMTSNCLLRLDFQQRKFEYCEPTKFSLWVEIFVVGDVSLIGTNYEWDTVTGIGQSDEHDDDDDSNDDDSDDDYDDDDNYDDDNDYTDDSDDNYDDDYEDEPRYNAYHKYYNNYMY